MVAQRLQNEFTPGRDEDEYRSLVGMIMGEVNRISGIVTQFLRYARPPELSFAQVNVAGLASDATALLRERTRAEGIEMRTEIPADLVCNCDPDQLKQALLNLLLNAVEAAAGKKNGDGMVTLSARRDKSGVRFRVTDTGEGIPDDIMPRIFDPYFTTRDTGTGLGLSEVHRIVSAHGGVITASNGDCGAVFEFLVPNRPEGH
jgi:signal transduction histidine kinase